MCKGSFIIESLSGNDISMRHKFKAALKFTLFRRISVHTYPRGEGKREKKKEIKKKKKENDRKDGTIRKAFMLIFANRLTGNVEDSGILPNA